MDHHVHAFSPVARDWFEKAISKPVPRLGFEDLMRVLDADGVERAMVLSVGYFFSGPGASDPTDRRLAQENDWLAEGIAKYPDRLAGCFSVNPLADTSAAEIDRCEERGSFVGLKLHLANSSVDLREPHHVDALASTFARANALGLLIVIHMRTRRPDYGREDAQIFIERVLPYAAEVPVQIAHAAGWGGYDQSTDGALSAFVDHVRSAGGDTGELYFDVSAVVRRVRNATESAEGNSAIGRDWWPGKRYERLVARLRAVGWQRVLFGTDWPEWTPSGYRDDIDANVPLDGDEMRVLLANRAPWLS